MARPRPSSSRQMSAVGNSSSSSGCSAPSRSRPAATAAANIGNDAATVCHVSASAVAEVSVRSWDSMVPKKQQQTWQQSARQELARSCLLASGHFWRTMVSPSLMSLVLNRPLPWTAGEMPTRTAEAPASDSVISASRRASAAGIAAAHAAAMRLSQTGPLAAGSARKCPHGAADQVARTLLNCRAARMRHFAQRLWRTDQAPQISPRARTACCQAPTVRSWCRFTCPLLSRWLRRREALQRRPL